MGEALQAARSALESISDRCIYVDGVGFVLVDDQLLDPTPNDPKIARFVGSSQKLLADLVEEFDDAERSHRAEVSVLLKAIVAWRVAEQEWHEERARLSEAGSIKSREIHRLTRYVERAEKAEDDVCALREAVETAVDFAAVVLGTRPRSTIDDERPKDYVSRHLAEALDTLRAALTRAEAEIARLREEGAK